MAESLFLYLLKVNFVLVVGYLFYRWALRRNTHFQLNRWVLMLQIGLMFLLPLVQLPAQWHPFWEERAEVVAAMLPSTPSESMESSVRQNQALASSELPDTWDFYRVGRLMYGMGGLFFFIKLCFQFLSLANLYRKALCVESFPGEQLVWCQQAIAPFSFFRWIFLPNSLQEKAVLTQILQHERIHVHQKHSWDVMATELLLILCWFNPSAWLYKRTVLANLEFLTDQKMLASQTPKKPYMHSLLSVSFPNWKGPSSIHYSQSFLQQRIHMMNTKASSPRSLWIYAAWVAMMPLLVCCNRPAVTTVSEPKPQIGEVNWAILISEDATSEELEQLKQAVEAQVTGSKLTISEVAHDSEGNISKMQVQLERKGSSVTSYVDANSSGIMTFAPIYFQIGLESLSVGHLDVPDLNQLIEQLDQLTLFSAGLECDQAALSSFHSELVELYGRAQQARLEVLEQKGWRAESTNSMTFRLPMDGSRADIQQHIAESQAAQVWYIVGNEEWQAEFPDLDWDQIQAVKIQEIDLLNYIPHTLSVKDRSTQEVQVRFLLK
ncbi:MAG: M56 family metallopeptidase [Bacteroidota bacterium]